MDPQIRTIFVEELEDLLETIERAVAALETAGEEERAALTVRRAFHTLKGAAHAVGETSIQVLCEEAESAIARSVDEPAAIARTTRGALPRLHARLEELRRQLRPRLAAERAETAQEARPEQTPSLDTSGTVRVAVDRVDAIVDTAEELAAALAQLHVPSQLEPAEAALERARALLELLLRRAELEPGASRAPDTGTVTAALEAVRDAGASLREGMRGARVATELVGRTSDALATEMRALRVGPFGTLEPGLEAAVAETAATLGRRARLTVAGGSTEIDRQLRDMLREPLLHLVRNAVDHGIEPPEERARAGKPVEGLVEVRASIVGAEVHIVVADDGRGIDTEAITDRARALGLVDAERRADPLALVFETGLSTREDAGPISGRGIGLDVVRDRVARMHGRVEVETRLGSGTRFLLRLPLSHGALRVVEARCRGVGVVLPAVAIERIRRLGADEDTVTLGGRLHLAGTPPVPLTRLDATLGLTGGVSVSERSLVWIVVRALGARIALGVDAVVEVGERIVHALSGRVHRVAGVSGTTITAGGEVALLLDLDAVARMAAPAMASPVVERARTRRVLVVDDSVTTRALQRTLLETAGYDVFVAGDGREALDVLRATDVDAVITDLEMPRLDGFELLERIRTLPRTRNLPVVLVTARDREADRRRALDLGASAYVLKREFDRDHLLALLEDLL